MTEKLPIAIALLLGCVSAFAEQQVELKYEAYIAGVNAGEARLTLSRNSDKTGSHYRVEGTARSKGLWEAVQQWRAEYSVDGVLAGESLADVAPGHFYSLQTTPKKRREIHIEAGVLRETKNHKVRDPRPSQTGYDLLSAVFFLPACYSAARVHTGRDGYELRRLGKAAESPQQCRYEVTDEDGDDYRMTLRYQQVGEFIVPAEVRLRGPLQGRLVLDGVVLDGVVDQGIDLLEPQQKPVKLLSTPRAAP